MNALVSPVGPPAGAEPQVGAVKLALAALLALAVACDEGRTVPPGTPRPRTPRDAGPLADGSVGGLDATIATGTHAARCTAACAAPSEGPCAAGSGWCPADCAARLDGLSATCAAYVTERSGYAGERCICAGANCTLCGFGLGGRACGGAAPGETCTASEERCDGYEHPPLTGEDCREVCVGADAGVSPINNQLRAALRGRLPAAERGPLRHRRSRGLRDRVPRPRRRPPARVWSVRPRTVGLGW